MYTYSNRYKKKCNKVHIHKNETQKETQWYWKHTSRYESYNKTFIYILMEEKISNIILSQDFLLQVPAVLGHPTSKNEVKKKVYWVIAKW